MPALGHATATAKRLPSNGRSNAPMPAEYFLNSTGPNLLDDVLVYAQQPFACQRQWRCIHQPSGCPPRATLGHGTNMKPTNPERVAHPGFASKVRSESETQISNINSHTRQQV